MTILKTLIFQLTYTLGNKSFDTNLYIEIDLGSNIRKEKWFDEEKLSNNK